MKLYRFLLGFIAFIGISGFYNPAKAASIRWICTAHGQFSANNCPVANRDTIVNQCNNYREIQNANRNYICIRRDSSGNCFFMPDNTSCFA